MLTFFRFSLYLQICMKAKVNRELFFYLNAFLGDIAVGLNIICVPLLAIKLGATPFVLGFTGFLASLTYLLFSPLFGSLSERKDPLFFTLIGSFLFALSSLTLVFFHTIPLIFLVMGIVGFATSMLWSPLEVWIARTTRNLKIAIGYYNLSWCLGLSLGTLLSGYLFQKNWRYPLIALTITCLLLLIFLLLCPRVPPSVKAKESSKEKDERNPFVVVGWTANFIGWFTLGVLRYLFPRLAVDLHISSFTLGSLNFLMSISTAISSFGLGYLAWLHRRLSFLIAIQLLMGAGFIIIYLTSSLPFFYLSFFILGISIGVAYFFSLFHSLEGEEGKGQRSGIHESIVGAGGLLGPLTGGIVAQHFNIRTPFLLCTLVLFIGILFEIMYYLHGRRNKSKIWGV